MTTTWTDQEKFEDQTSIEYNEANITYDEVAYQYNGKQGTVWTDQTKN